MVFFKHRLRKNGMDTGDFELLPVKDEHLTIAARYNQNHKVIHIGTSLTGGKELKGTKSSFVHATARAMELSRIFLSTKPLISPA